MTLTQQVYSQAVLVSGIDAKQQEMLLTVLCQSAVSGLRNQLRSGITPEDCKADFVAAASLFALAALESALEGSVGEEFRAGDLTVKRSGGSAASNCLFNQAELVIAPYLEDRFAFLGV